MYLPLPITALTPPHTNTYLAPAPTYTAHAPWLTNNAILHTMGRRHVRGPGQAGGGEVGTNLGVAVAVVVVTNTPELQDRITTSIHTKLATLFN